MEIELAVLNLQTKTELQPRVRKYRSDFDSIKRQFLRVQDNYIQHKDKETLMGAQMEDVAIQVPKPSREREQLMTRDF